MTVFRPYTFLKLTKEGATQLPPRDLIENLNSLRGQFETSGWIASEEILQNIDTMLRVLELYNHNEVMAIESSKRDKYNNAYNGLAKIFQEERRFQRLLDKLNQHEKSVGKLDEHQDKLKQIIKLAGSDDEFAALLDRKGFLDTLEQHNSLHRPEGELDSWLRIQKETDPRSEEERQYHAKGDIIEYWYLYLFAKSKEYSNTQTLNQLLADSKREYSTANKTLKNKIQEADAEIHKLKSVTQLIGKDDLLPAYSEMFKKEAKEHEDQSKKWGKYLFWAIVGLVVIVAAAYKAEIPSDVIPANGLAAEFIVLTIKASIVVAWIQIIRFINKKYFALCHLQQMAKHKSQTLKSMQAIYANTDDEKMRQTFLLAGAIEVFRTYETGYLSRKEGAGSTGSIDLGDFLQKINKK